MRQTAKPTNLQGAQPRAGLPADGVMYNAAPLPRPPEVVSALVRLRRDLDRFNAERPAVTYALVGETHKAIIEEWRNGTSPSAFLSLLRAFHAESLGLMRQYQRAAAISLPPNGFMFGVSDEMVGYETQADIMREEVTRLENEIKVMGDALHAPTPS